MSTSQRKSSSSSAKPDRRSVVLTGAAFVGASALPRPAPAADDGLAPAADLLAAMRTFLSSLEPDKRKAFRLPGTGRNGPDGITSAPPATSSRACDWSR